MGLLSELPRRPRRLGVLAATLATGLGMVAMAIGGAPVRYLAINGAALIIGIAMMAILLRSRADNEEGNGAFILVGALGLLATAMFGMTIDGTARWVRVGVVALQPSLILLPLMIIAYARLPNRMGTLGMIVAALALALQPDRAMAATLVAGLAVVLLNRRDRQTLGAFLAAVVGFAVTLLQPETLPATPFVEQVFAGAFAFSPLAGLVMLTGVAILMLPAVVRGATTNTFLALWMMIFAAAVFGNYPTPLLGYGGSGIIGYLLCLTALPQDVERRVRFRKDAEPRPRDGTDGHSFSTPMMAS
nr:FtsW/RodA/SpoVE family cell cycle protein [Polymorphobacter sp.]